MKVDLVKAKKTAEKAALKAGEFLIKKQAQVKVKAFKDRQDIVTNTDLDAEKIILKHLAKNFPSHNINSEERGVVDNNSQYTWVIDPLDGTKEYIRGLSAFTVNITLETEKETLLGVVYVPLIKNLFVAVKNQGAFVNGKKIQVSQEAKLENSFIYTHLPNYKMTKKRATSIWLKMSTISRHCYRLRGFQSDILSLCWLARGVSEGYILFSQSEKWWDIAAGLLSVQKAGGQITDMFGQPIKNCDRSKGMVVSNGKIHKQLLKALDQEDR